MIQLYSKKEVDKKALKGARIAVLGYGSQGRAHALNLKDSGAKVIIGLYPGSKSWKVAEEKGFAVYPAGEAVKPVSYTHLDVYKRQVVDGGQCFLD